MTQHSASERTLDPKASTTTKPLRTHHETCVIDPPCYLTSPKSKKVVCWSYLLHVNAYVKD